MKIAISGTHSTGKSTFIERLKAELSTFRIGIVGNFATAARDRGFPILHNHTFSSTIWIMAYAITLEQASALNNDLVLVDRPIMEPIAYLHAALDIQGRTISADEEACLNSIARSYAFTYDILIKTVVAPSIPISSEKERNHDNEFRLLVDLKIQMLYKMLGCKFIELYHEDVNTFDAVIRTIKSHLTLA